jgi:PAS domain S-box-containing protein
LGIFGKLDGDFSCFSAEKRLPMPLFDLPFLELVHNVSLLVSMAWLFQSVAWRWSKGKLDIWQIPVGIVLGAIGAVIMLTPWVYVTGIIFDTRSILLGISGIFFGAIPTLIAMAMTSILRLSMGGDAALTGILVIIASGSIGLLWRHLRQGELQDISWRELWGFGVVIHITMLLLMFTLPWEAALNVLSYISLPVLTIYPAGTAVLGGMMRSRLRREQIKQELVSSRDALMTSAEQYRFLFENNPHSMWVYDRQTLKFLAINDVAVEKYGYSRAEFLTMDLTQIRPAEEVPKLNQYLANLPIQQRYAGEWVHRAKDGRLFHMEVTNHPIQFDGRNAMMVVAVDATERKIAEQKLLQQMEFQVALREIQHVISGTIDMTVSLNLLVTRTRHLLKVDAVAILLANPLQHTLEYKFGSGFSSYQMPNVPIRFGQYYAGKIAINQKSIRATDASQMEHIDELTRESFVMYMGLPLISKGKLVGVMEVFHRTACERDENWMTHLETLAGQAALAIENAQTMEKLQRAILDASHSYDVVLENIAHAVDARKDRQAQHTQSVLKLTLQLAQAVNYPNSQIADLRRGVLLHDIGNLCVPDAILFKTEPLTADEYQAIYQHPRIAYEMFANVTFLRHALDVAYCHHEKWDGSGYPRGLMKQTIPLSARMCALADVWDALTSDRPYRPAWKKEEAIRYIQEQSGKHFDPTLVPAFLAIVRNSLPGTR